MQAKDSVKSQVQLELQGLQYELQDFLEVHCLRHKLHSFEEEKNDLELALMAVTEQGDVLTTELLAKLKMVRQNLESLKQDKTDLEISLETITQHADSVEQELIDARRSLQREIASQNRELAQKNQLLQAEIQERKRAEADLILTSSVFQSTLEGIFITDDKIKIIKVNQAYTNLTGYTEQESFGKDLKMFRSDKHDRCFYQNMKKSLLTLGYWSGEIWSRRKNQETFLGWFSISAVKNRQGEVTHYIGIFTDNTHQQISKDRIYYLAHYDALTDLPNRILFQERLEQAVKRAIQKEGDIALLFIDLDHFKAINDAFGHALGDQLLHDVAHRLIECLEGEKDVIARLGGDEFAIFLADLIPEQRILQLATTVAERILACLQQPFLLGEHEIFISASIGITIFPQDGDNAAELLKHADTAMYTVKAHGRGRYQFFAEPMNVAVHKRLNLQTHLRRALERDELLLYYQPQVNAITEQIVGVEALLRWQHPKLGIVSPSDFIPLAEESGLIVPIGEWVLHTACTQNYVWRQQGLSPIRMAVNLSVRQFNQGDLLKTIADILSCTHSMPHWLELEITETIAMNCEHKTLHILRALRELGIKLAIDDFGTGYSALNYLKLFTLDVLKIDHSFVTDIATKNGAALVSAIINMAHSLHMCVVAEGVETMQQLEFLRENVCDVIQGFLFYPPMLPAELGELLRIKQRQPTCSISTILQKC